MMRISATRRRCPLGQDRQRALDLTYDAEGHGERLPSVLPGHDNRTLATDGGDEALELEPERFALRCLQGDPLHEVVDRPRSFAQRREVQVGPQPIELAEAGA